MDIIRAFSDSAGFDHGITFNFQGTLEDPLFQAKQIGDLLGISDVGSTWV
jgi:hypothetical protein